MVYPILNKHYPVDSNKRIYKIALKIINILFIHYLAFFQGFFHHDFQLNLEFDIEHLLNLKQKKTF